MVNQNGRSRGRGGSHGGRSGPIRPKLPQKLQEQVDLANGGFKGKGSGQRSRKDLRKDSRHDRKGPSPRQGQVSQNPSHQAGSLDDTGREPVVSEISVASSSRIPPKVTSSKRPGPANSDEAPSKRKKKLPELTLPGSTSGPDKEDGEIEWLEWMLKHKKSAADKGKGKEIDDLDDGLDDLLELADTIGPGGKGLRQADSEGEAEESELDLDAEISDMDDGSLDSSSDGGDPDILEESDSSGRPEEMETEYLEGARVDSGLDKGRRDSHLPERSSPTQVSSLPDADQGGSRYVPPHMRAAALEEKAKGDKDKAAQLVKLERKTQGLLNKLSEANLEAILGEIEALYRDNSRNDVTTTITSLIIQMISNKANLLDSFVVLYATLVGALHRVIGMEFGAHFLHTLVIRYNSLTKSSTEPAQIQETIYETPDASKESLNLLVLIAELYNAGVVSSKLIYDLVRGFLGEEGGAVMDEKAVEGLLKILRCSGAQLRNDDPAGLKDIVTLVQDRTKGQEKVMSSRARFMVETLTNVRNGKIKATNGTEQGVAATGRMRQFLNGLGKRRRLLAYEPLRVSLSDLLTAETKGKWWLVGAGWSGNPLVDKPISVKNTGSQQDKRVAAVKEDEEVLLDLARKQGMNTDVRRSVFVVLMTSEDYVHACDRLGQFKLTETQQREFVRVALHCCGLEKVYNPYYTLNLHQLLKVSYSHRFTLQYALWDFMRELGETAVGGSASNAGDRFGGNEGRKVSKERSENVARALAFLIARGDMDLSIFKAVDFTALRSSTITFLTSFLIFTIIATQTASPLLSLPKTYTISSFDSEPLEELFEKTLSNLELAQGWLWLVETELGRKQDLGKDAARRILGNLGEEERQILKLGVKVARDVLGRAI